MNRDKLVAILDNYFGMDTPDGTMAYWLTRTKAAFALGTIKLDDFEEFTDECIDELADVIVEKMAN